ncbi:putative quinol monooxygenase [Zobellella sp. DQSA1]|uniref:putative quinol monooxygenase n=1 Tax=Zobellella sp. DQSA1 TaxID=3342386 RepID=UPI0035C20352
MSHHHLLAEIRSNSDNLGEVRAALATLEHATRGEEGCLLFSIRECRDKPGTFLLWESWQDEQALERHFSQPHTRHYLSFNYTEVVEITSLSSLEG